MADKVAATWHPFGSPIGTAGPFADWQETAVESLHEHAEILPGTDDTPDHRPVWEEGLPGQSGWICAGDDEPWPCTHEQQLTREERDRG